MRAVVLAGAGVLLAALAAAAGTSAPAHSPPGHIAFVQTRDGRGSIWTMNAFGTGLRRLTTEAQAGGNTSPAWTLTGTKIAYVSRGSARGGAAATEIWTMRADGSQKRQLTHNRVADGEPAWSPDGAHIVFTRSRAGGYGSLYVMDSSGSDIRRLSTGPYDGAPAWSPDGREIAFERTRLGKSGLAPSEIRTIPAEGGETQLLTKDAAEPAWSLDARRIAFSSQRDRFGTTCFHECYVSREVYVMDADGSNVYRVTRTKADDHSPSWSPDGVWVAMTSDRGDRKHHRFNIWLISIAPAEVIRATVGPGWDLEPSWTL